MFSNISDKILGLLNKSQVVMTNGKGKDIGGYREGTMTSFL